MSTTRLGKCINFGNCAKADRKETIELDVTEDFVCPECNSDLEIIQAPPPPPIKKIIIIIVAVLLLGGGAAAYFLLKSPSIVESAGGETTSGGGETTSGGSETTSGGSETTSKDSVENPNPNPQGPKPQPTQASGTISVAGGSYTGELKNGKPHGMGTLKYSTSTLISKRDPKNRYAEAGEYITGEFYEGELVNGKLFDKNGDQRETLNIGRAR